MNLALIPARGGSKRITNKNIKPFCGKPLILYSIQTALESQLFDDVVVSTDNQDIAKLAIEAGASVPFMRPAVLANDHTGTREVIEHGIQAMQQRGKSYEFCCCIYPTAPFIQVKYLNQGLLALSQQQDKAFAFTVTSFDFPVQRALKIKNDVMKPMFKKYVNTRSQDLKEAVHDAGQFYWGRTHEFLSDKALFSKHSIPIKLPRYLVQDIDTEEDWIQAELMYQAYKKR